MALKREIDHREVSVMWQREIDHREGSEMWPRVCTAGRPSMCPLGASSKTLVMQGDGAAFLMQHYLIIICYFIFVVLYFPKQL